MLSPEFDRFRRGPNCIMGWIGSSKEVAAAVRIGSRWASFIWINRLVSFIHPTLGFFLLWIVHRVYGQ